MPQITYQTYNSDDVMMLQCCLGCGMWLGNGQHTLVTVLLGSVVSQSLQLLSAGCTNIAAADAYCLAAARIASPSTAAALALLSSCISSSRCSTSQGTCCMSELMPPESAVLGGSDTVKMRFIDSAGACISCHLLCADMTFSAFLRCLEPICWRWPLLASITNTPINTLRAEACSYGPLE